MIDPTPEASITYKVMFRYYKTTAQVLDFVNYYYNLVGEKNIIIDRLEYVSGLYKITLVIVED